MPLSADLRAGRNAVPARAVELVDGKVSTEEAEPSSEHRRRPPVWAE